MRSDQGRQQYKRLVILLCAFLFLLMCFSSMLAFAGPGDGDGSGNGENKDIPIAVESCNVADGQTEVSVNAQIALVFNKNVVNWKVAANNKSSISLTDENGRGIAITAQMADDQIDPALKKNITIVPERPLDPGTKYTLNISTSFMAKNGITLAAPLHRSFTTAGTAAAASNSASADVTPLPANAGQPTNEMTTKDAVKEGETGNVPAAALNNNMTKDALQTGEPAKEKPAKSKGTANLAQQPQPGLEKSTVIPLLGLAIIVLVVIIAVIYLQKRKNGKK